MSLNSLPPLVFKSFIGFDELFNEISTCPRMENIPVRIPLPPPSDYGSIFKTQKTGNSKSAFM